MSLMRYACFLSLAAGATGTAAAEEGDWYISLSGGVVEQQESNNSGVTEAFTTGDIGDGTTLDFQAGSLSTFSTNFDAGFSLSLEVGRKLPAGFRTGIEFAYDDVDIDEHDNLEVAGTSFEPLDVSSVFGGAVQGLTVNELLNAGNGDIEQFAGFWNLYYDFDLGRVEPYVGAGVGVARVGVTYNPSLATIVNDNKAAFAYQGRGGVTFELNDTFDLFTEYTYRGTTDLNFQNELIPADLEVENRKHIVSVGLRY